MSEIVKAAFVGTSCIGKTTLLNKCREQFGDNAFFVDEAAREWFETHPEVTGEYRFSAEIQGQVQALALLKERVAHHQAEAALKLGRRSLRIFCDRSGLDAAVYVASQNDEEGAAKLLRIVEPWLPTYNNIFLLDPSDVPYETDSIRREDEGTRQHFHNAFERFFKCHRIPYTLLSGTLDERVAEVEHTLAA